MFSDTFFGTSASGGGGSGTGALDNQAVLAAVQADLDMKANKTDVFTTATSGVPKFVTTDDGATKTEVQQVTTQLWDVVNTKTPITSFNELANEAWVNPSATSKTLKLATKENLMWILTDALPIKADKSDVYTTTTSGVPRFTSTGDFATLADAVWTDPSAATKTLKLATTTELEAKADKSDVYTTTTSGVPKFTTTGDFATLADAVWTVNTETGVKTVKFPTRADVIFITDQLNLKALLTDVFTDTTKTTAKFATTTALADKANVTDVYTDSTRTVAKFALTSEIQLKRPHYFVSVAKQFDYPSDYGCLWVYEGTAAVTWTWGSFSPNSRGSTSAEQTEWENMKTNFEGLEMEIFNNSTQPLTLSFTDVLHPNLMQTYTKHETVSRYGGTILQAKGSLSLKILRVEWWVGAFPPLRKIVTHLLIGNLQ